MSSVYTLLTSTTLESNMSRAPLVFAVVQEDTTRLELAVHPLNHCDPVPKVLQLCPKKGIGGIVAAHIAAFAQDSVEGIVDAQGVVFGIERDTPGTVLGHGSSSVILGPR